MTAPGVAMIAGIYFFLEGLGTPGPDGIGGVLIGTACFCYVSFVLGKLAD